MPINYLAIASNGVSRSAVSVPMCKQLNVETLFVPRNKNKHTSAAHKSDNLYHLSQRIAFVLFYVRVGIYDMCTKWHREAIATVASGLTLQLLSSPLITLFQTVILYLFHFQKLLCAHCFQYFKLQLYTQIIYTLFLSFSREVPLPLHPLDRRFSIFFDLRHHAIHENPTPRRLIVKILESAYCRL